METRLRLVATVALIAGLAVPGVASAQTATPAEPKEGGIALFGASTFGRPLRLAGGVDALFLIGPTKNEDGLLGSQGIVAGGNLGIGGWQVSAGAFKAALPAIFSVRVVYTQTFPHPHVSDPKAAYLGASAGITLLYFVRANFGVDHRIRGTGGHRTLYVWSVGAHFYLWDSIKRR